MTGEGFTERCGIAFIENQINDMQNRIKPIRQVSMRWHFIGNACITDLCLCTYDTLRDGGRRREKRVRDLFGGESADGAQG